MLSEDDNSGVPPGAAGVTTGSAVAVMGAAVDGAGVAGAAAATGTGVGGVFRTADRMALTAAGFCTTNHHTV